MLEYDPGAFCADAARRLDKFLFFDRHDRGAYDARIGGDGADAYGDHCVDETRPERGRDGDGEQNAGDGEQHVDKTHDDIVRIPAVVGGGSAQGPSDRRADSHRYQSDLQRDARPVDDAAQNIPPEVVRTEPVFAAGRHERMFEILIVVVVRRYEIGENRHENERDHHDQPDDGRLVFQHPLPHLAQLALLPAPDAPFRRERCFRCASVHAATSIFALFFRGFRPRLYWDLIRGSA